MLVYETLIFFGGDSMVKKRVHEVAKELDLESKELVRQLARMGIEAKSHMSTLDDGDIEKLRKHFSAPKGKPAAGNKTGPTAQKTPAAPK